MARVQLGTAREGEILRFLAKRYSSKAIQETLCLSASTVSTHASKIYQKMNVHSKDEVADIVSNWKTRIQEGGGDR